MKSKIFSAIAIILLFASTFFMANVSAVDIETRLFISAVPNPVGIGQTLSIMWWLAIPNPIAGTTWNNVKVTVEQPDGTIETHGPLTSDVNGGAYVAFIPSKTGIYKVQATFPGQWVNTTGSNGYTRWYVPLESKVLEITVQEEPLVVTPELPYPTEYWTRPINTENREWYKISGNWLMGKGDKDAVAYEGSGNWNPYSAGPNTAHIMWTKELLPGGIAGGIHGYGEGYYGGLNYEAMFRPPIMMNGILYYETAEPPRYGINAVDSRTGETLWYKNVSYGSGFNSLRLGQILKYDSQNQHGTFAYLWFTQGSTWHMHDAFTGNYILSLSGVPSGYIQMGPNGEILIYTVNNAQGWVQMWNSTNIPQLYGGTDPDNYYTYNLWRPERVQGQTINGTVGIQWRTTVNTVTGAGNSIQWLDEKIGVMITTASRQAPTDPWPTFVHTAYSTETGQFLWTANRTNIGDVKYPVYIKPYSGIYVLPFREDKKWIGWDMRTGQELWRVNGPEEDWGIFDVGGGFVDDIFYTAGFAGIVSAYNTTTGQKAWEFYSGNSGLDTPYGTWAFYGASIIADGKIYIAHNEHSPDQPLWRGMKMWAIDAKTGEGVWNISGQYQGGRNAMGALADGMLITHNAQDNRIYSFGKGPSALTVSASPKVSVNGEGVLVEGTVMDISAGTRLNEQAARFPFGVPAVSDEDMTPWMEYVYMQRPRPADVTGVQVKLTAMDPNGNFKEIGTVTSDAMGQFMKLWVPEVPGEYTIQATFAGSESYWPSYAQTAVGVSEAPPPPAEPEPAPQTMADTYFIPALAGITVVMIVIIALLAMLLFKKRP